MWGCWHVHALFDDAKRDCNARDVRLLVCSEVLLGCTMCFEFFWIDRDAKLRCATARCSGACGCKLRVVAQLCTVFLGYAAMMVWLMVTAFVKCLAGYALCIVRFDGWC